MSDTNVVSHPKAKQKIVNLFGGPGAGKSTTMHRLVGDLKFNGVNAEAVSEYAKDATWEQRSGTFFRAQQYIWGKQSFRQERLRGQVDVIVVDSPIVLSLVYMSFELREAMPSLSKAILEDFDRYANLNIMMRRGDKPYVQSGRNQTYQEAKNLDTLVEEMLEAHEIPYFNVQYDENSVAVIKEVMQGWWHTNQVTAGD